MKAVLKSGSLALLMSVLAGGTALAETDITVMAYSGLFQERYTKAVIEPFMAAHPDIKVTYFPQPTSAAMLGNLRAQRAAPQTDVVIMDVSVSKAGTDEGVFARIDEKNVPNIADLYPDARVPGIAGAAVTFDNLVLLYNAKEIPKPPESWMDMADPAYRGKVVIPGVPDIQGLGLVLILDKASGGTNYVESVDKGLEAAAKIAPNVQTWEPKPEVYAPIVTGQAALGVGYNARAQVNGDLSGGAIKATIPKEGTIFQINTINLVADTSKTEAAATFINYALSPEAQKSFTETMFYAPTNRKAAVSKDAIARTAVQSMDKVMNVDWIALAKVRDRIANEWRRRVLRASH